MINPNDHIRFTNVVSRKYRFHYREMEEAMKDFLTDIVNLNATIKGPLYYSLNNVPIDEIMVAEFSIPVEDDRLEIMDDMLFHSYFSIERMISLCLVSEDFAKDTEFAYKKLIDYMAEHGKNQITPIFHVLSGDESLQFLYIKIGVAEEVL